MSQSTALLDRPTARKTRHVKRTLRARRWNTPIVGLIVAVDDQGVARVDFEHNPIDQPIAARSGVAIDARDVGASVVLLFERGDPARPIVVSKLMTPQTSGPLVNVVSDGDSLMISAQQQIVLQCGRASITLTRAGKIILRGAYLLSRSSGVNRIKGGSVQIN